MRSRTLQGIATALLTTSILWLSGSPAMAMPPGAAPAGLEIRLLEHLWQWLGDFWEPDGLTREAVKAESSADITSTAWTEPEPDRGGAIDPNGTR